MIAVDSATGAFLEAMRAAGGKPLHEMSVAEARATVRGVSLQLAPPAATVHAVEDRHIPAAGSEVGIRIYTPRPVAPGADLPIVLQFHGGGFVAGDLDTHDSIARHYAVNADVIVVSVDYRLAPEHRFPTAVDDAYAAVEWAAAHGSELQGDPGRIAVVGDSAGGTLATVVCHLAKARQGPRIAYQALVYPGVDFDVAKTSESRAAFGGGDYFLSVLDMEWFRSLYLIEIARETIDPRVSPLLAPDLGGLPPALVVTAGCDLLRDEGRAYADRLAAAGVPVEYRCFEGTIHAFMSFAGAIPLGLEALSFVASRLRAALHTSR